jgi:hypothetical protein
VGPIAGFLGRRYQRVVWRTAQDRLGSTHRRGDNRGTSGARHLYLGGVTCWAQHRPCVSRGDMNAAAQRFFNKSFTCSGLSLGCGAAFIIAYSWARRRPCLLKIAAPAGHQPARRSGSGLGVAPRSEFALQRQSSPREAALEHLATPVSFLAGHFRACASGSRAADDCDYRLNPIMLDLFCRTSSDQIDKPSRRRWKAISITQC